MSGVAVWVCSVLALLLGQAVPSPGAPCASGGGVRLRLHLSSRHNATGHRLLQAQVQSAGGPEQRVDVDVEQRETELGSGQLLAIDAVASVVAEEGAEQLDVRKGAVPDGDFEEVHFADYRPLQGDNAPKGLYKVHRVARTWPEAKAACEAEHAQLLVAETKAEAEAATRSFAKAPSPAHAQRADLFFVGLSDAQREGVYVSVTGKNLTSLEFQSWHAKEPSRGRDQNYLALDKEGNLHDIPNGWRLAFMCEAPSGN